MSKRTKTIKLSLTLILLVMAFNGNSQDINDFLEEQQTNVAFQKLYLHTDREFYFLNDTLWFAAYLLEGKTHLPASGVGNLYVDLINAEGKITQKQVFPLLDGFCTAGMPIADTIMMEGNYLLRAYTDYLKNFGSDAFFKKAIQVSTLKSSFDLEQRDTVEAQPKKIDVSFLPEGGFILTDKPNCVAFKAVDEFGRGIDIKGKLFDDQGNPVQNFKSTYKGGGKIYFLPQAGKSYVAKIDGYPEQEYSLGEVQEAGAKIKLNTAGKEKIQLVIQAKGRSQNFPHHLLCMNRGEGFLIDIPEKRLNIPINIDLKQVRGGINRFVLLNQKLEPISERLVFVNDAETIHYELDLDTTSFTTRDQVKLSLKTPETFTKEGARVSVTVIDENYVNISGISQNIRSYLLLDAELRGYVESPADYFVDSEKLSSGSKLDLLMTINGWRNYLWNHLDMFRLKHQADFGFTFKGNVKRTFGKKAPKGGAVSMIIYEENGTPTFFDQALDSIGNFEFKNVVIYDSVGVFAQVRNKRNKHLGEFSMELPKILSPEVNIHAQNTLSEFSGIPVSIYRQRYLDEMNLRAFYPERNVILLDEIEFGQRKKKPKDKAKTANVRKNDGPYTLSPMETAGTSDIIQYLAFKVPGVISVDAGESISLGAGAGEPQIVIDNGVPLSVEQAKTYSIENFETIELLTPPMSYFYRAPSGVVLLTTKSGQSLVEKNAPLMGGIVDRVKGFSRRLEFYAPKYDAQNIQSEAPDLRNTLYWNPNVAIVDGKSTLSFFTCDKFSNYSIFVEGISETGKICLGEKKFIVDTERK